MYQRFDPYVDFFFAIQVSLASRGSVQGLRLSFNFTGDNGQKCLVAPGFSTSKPLVNVPNVPNVTLLL